MAISSSDQIRRFEYSEQIDPNEIRAAFEEDGVLVVGGLFAPETLSRFRTVLKQLMQARLRALEISGDPGDSLDETFARLCAEDSLKAMDIIRIGKDLPEFYQAFTHPGLLRVVRDCLGVDLLQCVHDIAQIRIDPSFDHERDFGWHQDYQYNVASRQSVTAWYPLTPIDESMGYLQVIPGSHHEIARVRHDASRKVDGRGTTHAVYSLQLDSDELERRAVQVSNVEPGDAVLFHCLLLHRSGNNQADRARWVINPRYGDALDESVVSRGWRTMRDKTQEVFLEVHPELVDTE